MPRLCCRARHMTPCANAQTGVRFSAKAARTDSLFLYEVILGSGQGRGWITPPRPRNRYRASVLIQKILKALYR